MHSVTAAAMPESASCPPEGGAAPNRLREMIPGERPQERLQRLGPAALGDMELLAMLLRSGTRGQDVLTLASRLLAAAGSLGSLIAWREADYRKLKGIGRVKALQLITVMEVARRVLNQRAGEAPVLGEPEAAAAYLWPFCAGLEVEKFWVLCLNRKNRLLKRVEITSGTATASLAHPREVFREAIREGAVSIICMHNHPSGDPCPSAQDMQVTRQLREAARVLGIDLMDHIIVGRKEADPAGEGFYSFRKEGGI
ncbi:MAG: DNA repair protein RadC [Opitutaceae bacterium]|nr:DNA repair protein RadC [Opitutaceae bacterium]